MASTGRMYAVSFALTAVTAAVDLFEIQPADDKPVRIVGLVVSQNTDVGDAQDEVLIYNIVRGHTTSGSGGSAGTVTPLKRSDPAAGFTSEVLNTTAASAGTAVTGPRQGFNVRVGEVFWFPEECQMDAGQGDTTIVVRLMAAPADSITLTGTLYVEENG